MQEVLLAAARGIARDSANTLTPEEVKKLNAAAVALASSTAQLISGAAEASAKPKDTASQAHLSTATKAVSDSIADILKVNSMGP
jgi:X-X-X-Leu-X-X-Gly heptad repeat protein